MCASLPSRERGLKYTAHGYTYNGKTSLPSRERGLKSLDGMRRALERSRSLHGSVD